MKLIIIFGYVAFSILMVIIVRFNNFALGNSGFVSVLYGVNFVSFIILPYVFKVLFKKNSIENCVPCKTFKINFVSFCFSYIISYILLYYVVLVEVDVTGIIAPYVFLVVSWLCIDKCNKLMKKNNLIEKKSVTVSHYVIASIIGVLIVIALGIILYLSIK